MRDVNSWRREFRTRLLKWFAVHKRNLPWRKHPTPYRILIAEFMLQQTQVKTVIPYYRRWLQSFPDLNALAQAPLDQVLKLWEGLGYYTRARHLHRAAQRIVREFGGKIPQDLKALQNLPGIGRYTAGAVASIAFEQPVSLVDGNVMRVLSRLFDLHDDISKPMTQKKFYQIADALVPSHNPGAFNQALMELGSLVCLAESPLCPACPVQSLCRAYQRGRVSQLPFRGATVRIKKIEMVVGLLAYHGRLLVRRRPEHGIWGGLWEIPGTIRGNGKTREETILEEFKEKLGISVRIQKSAAPLAHRFTHRKAKIYPYLLTQLGNRTQELPKTNARWARPTQLARLSFPVAHQKILRAYSLTMEGTMEG